LRSYRIFWGAQSGGDEKPVERSGVFNSSPEQFFYVFFTASDSFVNAVSKGKKVPGSSCRNYR
jgi:hypothetical protein